MPGDTEAPVMAASGSGAVIATVVQHGTTRVHRLLLARAGQMRELFQQPETMDDGLSIAIADHLERAFWSRGTTIVRHTMAPIVSQFVPHDATRRRHCRFRHPPTRVLTPPDQDAADPVIIPLPNGTAILAWLASQDVDADIANQTAADVYVMALSATACPAGAARQDLAWARQPLRHCRSWHDPRACGWRTAWRVTRIRSHRATAGRSRWCVSAPTCTRTRYLRTSRARAACLPALLRSLATALASRRFGPNAIWRRDAHLAAGDRTRRHDDATRRGRTSPWGRSAGLR